MFPIFFRYFLYFVVILVVQCECSLIVRTTTGLVRGKLNQNGNLRYFSYQRIPYAESPTGNLRFMPPKPKKPWLNILDATKEGPVCPQPEKVYKRNQMSEDCLFTNIYVPETTLKVPLPIYVYIHGGGFRYDPGIVEYFNAPELLLKENIIFVFVSFRLGVGGFLSLDIPEASGNAGLKDVILALKWIKLNIQRFGGDIANITIGGQSSGASMAHYTMLTEKSTDLFHRVILMSGSAVGQKVLSRHCKDNALLLSRQLGLTSNDSKLLVEQLKQLDAFKLEDAYWNLTTRYLNIFKEVSMFIPCIEINTTHALFTQDPKSIIRDGIPQNVPVLTGITATEGLTAIPRLRNYNETINKYISDLEHFIPSNIEYPQNSSDAVSVGESIRKFYLGDDNLKLNYNYTRELVTFITDAYYVYGVDYWINLHKSNKNSNNLYYYMFDFDGSLNWAKINYNITEPGVSHADDLGYVFKTKVTTSRLSNLDDRSSAVLKTSLTFQINFIKYGNPTPNEENDTLQWPEYDDNKNIMIISESPYAVSRDDVKSLTRLDFLRNVYEEYQDYVAEGGAVEKKTIP